MMSENTKKEDNKKGPAVFKRTKPTIDVVVIGHVDHGKTTLGSAITKMAAERFGSKFKTYEQICTSKEERDKGITISLSVINYETEKYSVVHTDAPGHRDFVKNTVRGMNTLNAILVVSTREGAQAQTYEHIRLAKSMGIENIIIVLTKLDMVNPNVNITTADLLTGQGDSVLLETVEITLTMVKGFLAKFGYSDDKIEVCIAYPLYALNSDGKFTKEQEEHGRKSILELLSLYDKHFKVQPVELLERPTLMYISKPYHIAGRGIIASGSVKYGSFLPETEAVILGGWAPGAPQNKTGVKVRIQSIESFKQAMANAIVGDNIGISIKSKEGFDDHTPTTGQVITYNTSAYKCIYRFRGIFTMVSEEDAMEGEITVDTSETSKNKGRQKIHGIRPGITPTFLIESAYITGVIRSIKAHYESELDKEEREKAGQETSVPEGTELKILLPGDIAIIEVELQRTIVAIPNETRFVVRESGNTIGFGRVVEIIE